MRCRDSEITVVALVRQLFETPTLPVNMKSVSLLRRATVVMNKQLKRKFYILRNLTGPQFAPSTKTSGCLYQLSCIRSRRERAFMDTNNKQHPTDIPCVSFVKVCLIYWSKALFQPHTVSIEEEARFQ